MARRAASSSPRRPPFRPGFTSSGAALALARREATCRLMEPRPFMFNGGPHAGPTRWSTPADAEALARLHAETWRYAYSGVIPDPGLSRLISRRGPEWWRRMHEARGSALLGLLDRQVVAYALIGRSRAGFGGEIWELYVHPDCHGAGYGRRLFDVARDQFAEAGLAPVSVWCLEENALGLGFYRALGGEESPSGSYRIAGARLSARRFIWT